MADHFVARRFEGAAIYICIANGLYSKCTEGVPIYNEKTDKERKYKKQDVIQRAETADRD
jgi:hypothetical protein